MANFPPASSPQFEKWERLADEYPTVKSPVFQDGGMDSFLLSTTPIRRWRITYSLLTVAEATILDNWFAANYGTHATFTFTDRDATVYGGVRCVSYQRGHGRLYANTQTRVIEFEDRV